MIKPSKDGVIKMVRAVLLRQYRLDLKIPSVKLAEKLPFHNSKLSQLENGYSVIQDEVLAVILAHYKISVEEFNKRAQIVYDEIQDDVVSLRYRSQWITLYRATLWVFEKRIRAGYSIYEKVVESANG